MTVRHFRDLIVWKKAMDLAVQVYRSTESFPRHEVYGLTSQTRRAAVSVSCNIAEGQGRSTTKDFLHFLAVAKGSLQELETQIILAVRLSYLDEGTEKQLLAAAAEVARLLNGLVNSLTTDH
jgi:four helix bundle protein